LIDIFEGLQVSGEASFNSLLGAILTPAPRRSSFLQAILRAFPADTSKVALEGDFMLWCQQLKTRSRIPDIALWNGRNVMLIMENKLYPEAVDIGQLPEEMEGAADILAKWSKGREVCTLLAIGCGPTCLKPILEMELARGKKALESRRNVSVHILFIPLKALKDLLSSVTKSDPAFHNDFVRYMDYIERVTGMQPMTDKQRTAVRVLVDGGAFARIYATMRGVLDLTVKIVKKDAPQGCAFTDIQTKAPSASWTSTATIPGHPPWLNEVWLQATLAGTRNSQTAGSGARLEAVVSAHDPAMLKAFYEKLLPAVPNAQWDGEYNKIRLRLTETDPLELPDDAAGQAAIVAIEFLHRFMDELSRTESG
jgi:hypothetical protein